MVSSSVLTVVASLGTEGHAHECEERHEERQGDSDEVRDICYGIR